MLIYQVFKIVLADFWASLPQQIYTQLHLMHSICPTWNGSPATCLDGCADL